MSKSMKAMRVARRMSQSCCIVLLLLTCGALSAQNQQHRIRNVVLVHGAWADGSGWKGVYDILVKDGYNVSIVQEPETSFTDDVAATKVLNFADNFSATITTAAWRTKPSWMLVAGSDRTISPDLERWYGKRAKSHTLEVAGASHSVVSEVVRF
jgi:hypothetical protein